MSDEPDRDRDPSRPADGSATRRLLASLPSWKVKLLGAALILALVGGGGQVASSVMDRSAPPVSFPTDGEAGPTMVAPPPPGASGFVDARRTTSSSDTEPVPANVTPEVATPLRERGRFERIAPMATRIGISFLVGMCLGIVFRTFLKTMAAITAAVTAVIMLLSYFQVLNLDFSTMEVDYDSAAHWLADQAGRLREVVMNAVPSSASVTIGFLSGFKKR